MSESLRMRVVEAGARAMHRQAQSHLTDEGHTDQWRRLVDRSIRAQHVVLAEAALDAMLDVLAENADEWGGAGNNWAEWLHDDWGPEDIIGYQRGHSDRHAKALLAVLREDR